MRLHMPRRLIAAFVLFAALAFAGVGTVHSAARTAAALGPASAGVDLADICGGGGAGDIIESRDCPWCRIAGAAVVLPEFAGLPVRVASELLATLRPKECRRALVPAYGRIPPARAPPHPV